MRRIALTCLVLVGCGSSSGGGDDDGGGSPLTQAEAVTACVMYGSCLGDGINDCYTDAMPYWSVEDARCLLATAGNCKAVRACFGITVVADPACTSSTYTCDGTNLIACGGGARSTVACGSALRDFGSGPTCVPTTTGGALCGAAACSSASDTCDGTVASSCNVAKGVMLSSDCADYGQQCVNGVCTAPGGGGACATGTPPHCAGTTIDRCSAGIDLRTDCAALAAGASCFELAAASEPYCGYGNECYPTKGAETCSGTSVTFCGAGMTTTVDCTSLGFTSCFGGHCAKI